MTEQEIIIANLKAQVIIEKIKAKVFGQWILNTDMQLQQMACNKTADILKSEIKKLTSKK